MRSKSTFLCSLMIMVAVLLGMVCALLPTSQAKAEDTVLIGPQFEFEASPSRVWNNDVAFDSINNRFLIVWAGDRPGTTGEHVWAQLVNADGTLVGGPTQISGTTPETMNSQQLSQRVAFDPVSTRFLVIFADNHSGNWQAYGQLVNADGSLCGDQFFLCGQEFVKPDGAIVIADPDHPPYFANYYTYVGDVASDLIHGGFMVTFYGFFYPGYYAPVNACVQAVSAEGQLIGPTRMMTHYTEYTHMGAGAIGSSGSTIAYDNNHNRFLVTWLYSRYDESFTYHTLTTCGRVINGDGSFYSSEIEIDNFQGGIIAPLSPVFDPLNNKFALFYRADTIDTPITMAQLVNADGTLCGAPVSYLGSYGWGLWCGIRHL